jgi:hypothetical protein
MLFCAGLLAGCGGDDDDTPQSGTTDVNQLLEQTFAGSQKIESGTVDLTARLEGAAAATIELQGPFQAEEGRLPRFDLDASLEGGGQQLTAGLTSTGDQGFVSYQGTEYEVSGPVYRQLQAAYEQAQQQGGQQGTSLTALGIDPRNWLTDARVAGDSEVGGTETIKITGGVDVPKLLDDVNVALERIRSLGLQGSEGLPEQLTDEEKRQAAEAVRNLRVEIETGKDDKILRRLAVSGDVTAEGDTLGVTLDLSLLEVNEDQEIEAPDDARPFNELLGKLQELGLPGLGGAPSSGSGSGGGASSENLEKYSQCVQDAGSDPDKLRKCGELLNP